MVETHEVDIVVEREIEAYKLKNDGRFDVLFFNNLDRNLAGGGRRKFFEKGILSDEDLYKKAGEGVGPLLRSKTVSEFWQDCDDAVKEVGLTLEEVIKARQIYEESDDKVESEKFAKFLLPIYKNLRKKGYKHYPDLTG